MKLCTKCGNQLLRGSTVLFKNVLVVWFLIKMESIIKAVQKKASVTVGSSDSAAILYLNSYSID